MIQPRTSPDGGAAAYDTELMRGVFKVAGMFQRIHNPSLAL